MTDKLADFVTSRFTPGITSLHNGRKHIGFKGGGNGKLGNVVKYKNSLHRGSLHPGLTVLRRGKNKNFVITLCVSCYLR